MICNLTIMIYLTRYISFHNFSTGCRHLVNNLAAGTQPNFLSSTTYLLTCINNYVEMLSTLRFGQRVRSIQNQPVINEIIHEDMDDLTDQIRQLNLYSKRESYNFTR